MDDSKQQIIHYFIEEAQEHLDVVEHGLLDLGEVIKDADRVNELFRAAHSVKGGAAMLGFDSIQKIAHQLEDCFKIMRDHSIPVDRQLESMFLKGYDALKALVGELAESPTLTLRPEVVEPIVQNSLGNFAELKEYINDLLGMGTIEAPLPMAQLSRPMVAAVNAATAVMAPPVNLSAKVMENLKAMLGAFKQGEAAASRPQIASYCQALAHLDIHTATWQNILKISAQAIGNSANAYEALAPVVIKELKLAGDLLAVGKGQEIAPSPALQALAIAISVPVTPAAPAQISIPLDARGAAQLILRNFNRQQISDMIVLLHRAINQPKQN